MLDGATYNGCMQLGQLGLESLQTKPFSRNCGGAFARTARRLRVVYEHTFVAMVTKRIHGSGIMTGGDVEHFHAGSYLVLMCANTQSKQ